MNCSLLRKCGLMLGLLSLGFLSFAQPSLKFKLQLMPDGQRWGVYVKPVDINPSLQTITGTGQVTVVMPKNYQWTSLTSIAAIWQANAIVHGPIDNPTKSYVSFGMVTEFPHINLQNGQETLLFTFKSNGTCPDSIYLIDSNDPFSAPNSIGSSPDNEMTVFDPQGGGLYEYLGNYAPSAWSCHDNDNDGILNAHEDTNGNGVYDAGVDVSDLNQSSDSGINFKLQLLPDGERWGVYAKPVGITPSLITITGSAQVTVVMPLNYGWNSLNSYAGTWQWNVHVNGPIENPNNTYISFGMMSEYPHITLQNGQETLLFTFKGDGTCPDSIYLIDNNDPFIAPNSTGSNPGNEITIFDPQGGLYEYSGNYAPSAWSCYDNDNDGILNAHEDTNGNGVYDAGVDASDLNTNECAITITNQPENSIECLGQTTSFSATFLNNSTLNNLTVNWQISYTPNDSLSWVNIPTGGFIYGGTTNLNPSNGISKLLISDVTGLDGAYYRLAYRKNNCIEQYSDFAGLTVRESFTFSTQPVNVDICAGEPADLSATVVFAAGIAPEYVWQLSSDNGLNWVDINSLTDGGIYSNFNSPSLHISNSTGLYTRLYRLAVSSAECNRKFSQSAGLNMDGPILFEEHPKNFILCDVGDVEFSAVAKTLSLEPDSLTQIHYAWEESNDGGSTWLELAESNDYTGTNSSTLSIKYNPDLDANCYRLKIWTDYCDAIYSNPACIDVEGPMTVIDEPDHITQCAGEGASFHAEVAVLNSDPNDLIYHWEYSSDNGVTWSNVPSAPNDAFTGENSNTLNISDVSNMYGWRFRMRYRLPACDARWTNWAELTVEGPISFTSHPDHIVKCSGHGASFIVQTNNTGQGSITYQWQICVSGDSLSGPWLNVPNSSIYNGTKTALLSISNTAGFNGFYYRCLIHSLNCSPIASYAAVLTVEGPINITSQPTSQATCQGESSVFTAAASISFGNTGTMQYQWQMSSDGVNYANLSDGGANELDGTDSPTLSIGDNSGLNGKKFRLAVKTSECNHVYSLPASLTTLDCNLKCLKLKLQAKEPNTWAVMARPFGNYEPTDEARTMSGRVTVVAPADFNLIGLNNSAGEWSAVNITENVPGHPGRKYITFEMAPGFSGEGVAIPYSVTEPTQLFTLHSFGPCPDSLYLLENVPPGLLPNELSGHDLVAGLAPVSLEYCGVYARKSWRCKTPVGGGGTIIPPFVIPLDSLTTPDLPPTDREKDWEASAEEKGKAWFNAYPNPVGALLNVAISEGTVAEGKTSLLLYDLQGKKHLEIVANQAVVQIALDHIQPGVYFLSLSQNGRILQREKLIKH
ncbi:MAG: T9SS type A sorting domain-containing protein [Saprospiraceae bacterium]|nr:T9SS type A sorting domain-containing protein [Saprospiraceae bacterium]